jgi:hypothetical protein
VARRDAGLSGAALFIGVGGLYLAYAGVRDVPLVEGLRSLLRGQAPPSAKQGPDWAPITMEGIAAQEGDGVPAPQGALGDTGISRLKGGAALAYPILKAAFPHLHFGGWRPQGSVPNSDHPKGLALDISGGVFGQGPEAADATAKRVIALARSTPGFRVWIWNRHYGSGPPPGSPCGSHCGPSPHTDHVHISWR